MERDLNKEVAGGLRANRAKARVSQADLAKVCKVNQTTVSAWENRGGIGVEDAWRLADYYSISLDDLVGRKAG